MEEQIVIMVILFNKPLMEDISLQEHTESFGNGDYDVYLIKTDGSGNVTSTFNIPINPNRKLEKVVDILGKQTKPQTNTPFIEIE